MADEENVNQNPEKKDQNQDQENTAQVQENTAQVQENKETTVQDQEDIVQDQDKETTDQDQEPTVQDQEATYQYLEFLNTEQSEPLLFRLLGFSKLRDNENQGIFQPSVTFDDSAVFVHVNQVKEYLVKTESGHSQLRDLLHFSSDGKSLYFCNIEEPVSGQHTFWLSYKNVVCKLDLESGIVTKVNNSIESRILCYTVNYGYIIISNGSKIKILSEADQEILHHSPLTDFHGDQINGVTLKKIDGRLLLFVSRNGGYVIVFELVRTEEGLSLELHQKVLVSKNANSVIFGSGPYARYMVACLDDSEWPWIGTIDQNLQIQPFPAKFPPHQSQYEGYSRSSMLASWFPSKPVFALGSEDGTCDVVDFMESKCIVEYNSYGKNLKFSQIRTIAFSQNQEASPILVFGEESGLLHIVETHSWTCKQIKVPSSELINGLKFSSDFRHLYVAFSSRIIKYRIFSEIASLKQLTINYISSLGDKIDISSLPLELQEKIKNQS
eukprot:TRINITY_DN839_c0_g1_i1.p1 TRINITY_DN839_c0_g1~~TRINITY_DN839_c0_g1_i1.p1  ORF type:complete len:497 (+),score=81.43 TRINITY_DN839_c0_g1_i1:44-1534(+)